MVSTGQALREAPGCFRDLVTGTLRGASAMTDNAFIAWIELRENA